MKRIFGLLIIAFALTGCTVSYDIKIGEDGSVAEKANVEESEDFFEKFAPLSHIQVIESILSKNISQLYVSGYDVTKNERGIVLTNNYSSLKEFTQKSLLINQLYEEIVYEENGSTVKIYSKGKFVPYSDEFNVTAKANIKNANISIYIPFKVSKSTADKVDRIDHIYTWYVDEERKSKPFYLEIDKQRKAFNYEFGIPIIVTFGIVLAIAIGTVIMVFKNKRSNQV